MTQADVVIAPRKYRRRASSVQTVENVFAAARKVCNDQGDLAIMTEYISIKPVSLSFSKGDLETVFINEHKDKFRPRFRPMLVAIAVGIALLGIPDLIYERMNRLILKLITVSVSLFMAAFATTIYNNDRLLVLCSSALAYLLLFTRIIQENELGVYLEAHEKDVGFVFLIYAILGTVIGLRFIVSIIISTLIAIFTLVSIWTTPSDYTHHLRIQASFSVLVGFYFFNMVLTRRLEIQERRDFRLTKRLAAENVHVQMQMENFSLFSKGIVPKATDSSVVSPGSVLSIGCRIAAADIELMETIGVGAYGDVMKGKYKGTTVAIKKVRNSIKDDVLREIGSESSIMAELRHPNIVMFMGLCLFPPMIVMEYCQRGSLFNAIHVDRIPLDWSLLLRMLMDAAQGMAFLHRHDPPILHRDLKSLNLLLDENWRCKVSDFGLSKLKKLKQEDTESSQPLGSVPWMAPETTTTAELTEKADVYSFGVIIFELINKAMPYDQIPMQGIPYLVVQGKRPTDYSELKDLPKELDGLAALMKSCWAEKPEKRPDFETIIEVFEDSICPAYFGDQTMQDAIVFPREGKSDDEIMLKNIQFNINEKELSIGSKIGGGTYGAVYAGKWLGTEVAIKQLFINSLPEKVLLEFNKECDLMRQMRHPNIVLFLGSSAKPPNLFLVTELMAKGSLFDIYHSENPSSDVLRHFALVVGIATDMARGMAYLHSRDPPLIHRDLKSPNIMIDNHWVSKIGDFGLSRLKDETKTMTKCGSPLWVAPEVLQGQRFAEGCDIYSFAIIVWEAMAWSEPYPDLSSKVVMREVALHGLRPTLPQECPEELRQLLTQCWQRDPNKRPTFKGILDTLETIESVQCKI